jgi:hypothetical protein
MRLQDGRTCLRFGAIWTRINIRMEKPDHPTTRCRLVEVTSEQSGCGPLRSCADFLRPAPPPEKKKARDNLVCAEAIRDGTTEQLNKWSTVFFIEIAKILPPSQLFSSVV